VKRHTLLVIGLVLLATVWVPLWRVRFRGESAGPMKPDKRKV
jgi:hypothetical protein